MTVMDLFNFEICCILWFVPVSNVQSRCDGRTEPIIEVCTDQDVTNTSAIVIDTNRVPIFKETSCECVITSFSLPLHFVFNAFHFTETDNSRFEIKDIAIKRHQAYAVVNLTEATKLHFSTNGFYRSNRVCVLVYPEDGTGFNISCSKATNETKIPVTVTQGSEITEITLEPNHDNGLPSADNNCGENNVTTIIIPSVICAMLLVIIVCFLVYIRRLRSQIESQHQLDKPPHTVHISVIETLPDPDQVPSQEEKVASASFNTYERLNMYDNENCSAEMYQQLDVVNG
ncbi:uncharacterized protein LOC132752106 [Ruditapes philippinarum]|uniref:uncharacterized protein LOC132752106 n=1 Tax=Ruditapes philippinarum TaxID=129788 RepID=UPI00295B9FEE|nr:uncharacterized protein LOC132752106 [Ruditapes philippinarum]